MEKVINHIINYATAENPIANYQLSALFNISEVAIRKHINRARCEGIPICASSKGYYYSTDKADILDTIQSLNNRTIAVEKAIGGLLTALIDDRTEESKI